MRKRWYRASAAVWLAVSGAGIGAAAPAAADPGAGETQYSVAFTNPSGLPANVEAIVSAAGGTITDRLPEIGGVGATSSDPDFAAALARNPAVKAAARAVQTELVDPVDSPATSGAGNHGGTFSPAGPDPQPMPDPLGKEQWDKMRMNATLTGSYALQRGRKDVRVFVVDTGADQTHIDVAPNLDVADSRSFVPTEPTIQDFNGHGTWTISAVGAHVNGVGISGVAPNVTLVAGKVLNAAGRGSLRWTDQALIYAGQQHFDIISASLGGYIPKCGSATNPNGCDHADYILLNRATQFARSHGVLPIAALGNDGVDLSAGSSMRDTVAAPAGMPGWVGVAATSYYNEKAYYSNYGSGKADVSAPGGSSRNYSGVPGSESPPGYPGQGRLIGAWSSTASVAPGEPRQEGTGPAGTPPCYLYGYVQGTSMAAPNAAGVAALIISQYGDFPANNPNKTHMAPTTVEQYLAVSANNQPCPTPRTVVQGPGPLLPTATCQGGIGSNNFFGKGIVDAVKAVTLKTP